MRKMVPMAPMAVKGWGWAVHVKACITITLILSGCAGRQFPFLSTHFELYHPENIVIAPPIFTSDTKLQYIGEHIRDLIEGGLYERGYSVSSMEIAKIGLFINEEYSIERVVFSYTDSAEFILIIFIDDAFTNFDYYGIMETTHRGYSATSRVTASATVSITGHLVHRDDLLELWRDKAKRKYIISEFGAGDRIRDEFLKKTALTNAAEVSVKILLKNFPQCIKKTTRMNKSYDQKE